MKPGNVPTACTDRNSLFEGQEIAFTINIFFKRDFSSREIVFTIIFFEKVFFEKVGSFFRNIFTIIFHMAKTHVQIKNRVQTRSHDPPGHATRISVRAAASRIDP